MKRKFVVLLNSSNEAQNDAFREWVRSQKLANWHWLSNCWLLASDDTQLNSRDIMRAVKQFYPTVNNLVIELKPEEDGTWKDSWAGFGPSTEERSMFRWLKHNWDT